MKAIILAAGRARRMRPLSDQRHKTLLEVDGRSIMGRIIDALVDSGIDEICLVTGYRAEEVEHHVMTLFPGLRFSFVHNPDFETTNNVYSMALALEQFNCDEDIILIESDLVFEPAVLQRLVASRHENVALVDAYGIGMDGTVVTVSPGGTITQVIPPSLQDERFDFSDKYKTLNIYKFSAEFCRTTFRKLLTYYARVIDGNCYYELILGILIYMQQVQIHAEVLTGERWAELDDPNDLRQAEFVFAPAKRAALLASSWGGYWTAPVLDFAFIRNMYFPSPAIMSELRTNLPNVIVNYGSAQRVLDEKLAYFLLCDARNLRVLNGASQLFPTLRRLFGRGDVLLPTPTFGEYTRMFPTARTYADPVARGRVKADIAEVRATATDAGLVVFVNPNNPTGMATRTEEIAAFAQEHRDATVLVDESFIEFSMEPSIVGAVERDGLDNVVVLKSLSKSLGVPGVRLGFAYSVSERVLGAVDEDLPVWNLNSVAENFLELLLKHRLQLAESFRMTVKDRAEFAGMLGEVTCVSEIFPSEGNFLLVRLSMTAEASVALAERLVAEQLIYVKDVSHKFVDGGGYWRLAVRTPGENERLCSAVGALVGSRRRSRAALVSTAGTR